MAKQTWIIGGGAIGALLAIAVVGGWYLFLRDDAPPAVNLADAVAAAATAETVEAGTETAEPSHEATAEPAPSGTPDASTIATPTPTPGSLDVSEVGLVGEWALAADAESFVGYRVQEELARIGAATAVGRSSDLSASLSFEGTTITAVEVEANLGALQSDDNRRDRALRN